MTLGNWAIDSLGDWDTASLAALCFGFCVSGRLAIANLRICSNVTLEGY